MKLDAIFNLDRRIIFVAVFLTLLIPMLFPYAMPCKPRRDVNDMYAAIEQAADNHKAVLLSFEFDPTGQAEQEPMARAILRHLFARGGKVVVMNKNGGQLGQELHLRILRDCAQEYGAEYGKDWVYLPFQLGSTNLVINLGQNLASVWPKDVNGTDVSEIPVLNGVRKLGDFDYVVVICSSLTPVVDWLTYGQGPHNVKMGFGVLGNVTPDVSNYVNSGQIVGLLGGLVGAAQYEQLLKDEGIGLIRRFSPADLVTSRLGDLSKQLINAEGSPVAAHVWSALTPDEQNDIKTVAASGRDTLKTEVKEHLATALNEVITGPDVIPDSELAKVKAEEKVQKLLERPELAGHRTQVLRRLAVEGEFAGELRPTYGAGQAMEWMTPQSIAHVTLIVAILFGNVCFFWERARRKRGQS